MNTVTENKPKVLGLSRKEIGQTWYQKAKRKTYVLMFEKGWLIAILGFLLGRAVMLSLLSPFSIAFMGAVWFMRREQSLKMVCFILLGSLTVSFHQFTYVFFSFVCFLIASSLLKIREHKERSLLLAVGLSSFLARIFLYSLEAPLAYIDWTLAIVEAVLAIVLLLIFMQSIPLLSPKRYKPALRHEEIICMIILIASVLTGFLGLSIYGAQMEQILSRYLVLILALVGGATIGSTVGVVAGLILSLANVANLFQISLLAFSGLLGGLLKEGKKVAVGIGLLIGTLLMSMYTEAQSFVWSSLIESCLAVGLFFLTPYSAISAIARYIPGTTAHQLEQEKYLKKVRQVTAHKVTQFSDVFHALSRSFQKRPDSPLEDKVVETDDYLSKVTEKTCQSCFKKNYCWARHFDETYDLFIDVKNDLEEDQKISKGVEVQFQKHCVKSEKVTEVMQQELSDLKANQKLKKQVEESRRFVANQLAGVSEVMGTFAEEIMKERKNHERQELEIVAALKHVGIDIEKLDIYRLEKGNVDIEMYIRFKDYRGEGAKIIAPILSDILKETIIMDKADISPLSSAEQFFSFQSAKQYVLTTGAAHAAKGGSFISGDSFKTLELSAGKYALAISDGMGNGERAHEESTEALRLLQQILQTGLNEQVAIQSINSILALRSEEEVYATLDLAMVDLHHATVKFLKIGSSPSFIKRPKEVIKIESSNLPIGIVEEFEVEVVDSQLKDGDILVMMSDGIFEGPKNIENVDRWIKRKLGEIETNDPQMIADLLLEEVIRTQGGEIEDDMTVLVSRIERFQAEWAPIRTSYILDEVSV
ncbi:stage II sporulation protein E [Saliterribacillus persicus]|uniref:Stage II sporulation protein E n=1 Tax=Saliterribacillus persicus TaxID=930114 RepID=A0A368X5E1_9BACI|nr:stage II sporulation protein E [Saliterribacillus persicus]RCW63035.1 stage II sporulation protein E [Saliterribacillus persicus]